MKYQDEYRDKDKARKIVEKIKELSKKRVNFMEVCGTHTMSIFRHGIKGMLPGNIRLLSGPGCPVCVTPNEYIDKAVELARKKDVVVVTFGDMIKVPGTSSSLEKEKSDKKDIRIVYSPSEAVSIAEKEKNKQVVFLGVGFETTSPTVAAAILEAQEKKIKNFSVLCAHKLIPPAIEALLGSKKVKIDGFILPGHVSVIIGERPYKFIAFKYGKPAVIMGFEPVDILSGIYMLVYQVESNNALIANQYKRAVHYEGNAAAIEMMDRVFERADSEWRGIGIIPNSGLKIRDAFSEFDAEKKFVIKTARSKEKKGCICGSILRGEKTPEECKLFRKICTPENPMGACMVSSEGTCAAYFKYSC